MGGAAATPVMRWRVDDRDTSSAAATHKAGEPLKQNNANFALLNATGEPVQSAGLFLGIAHNESDETATAEGTVDIEMCTPWITRIRGKATTIANADTDTERKGIEMDAVTFDLTSGVFTIDENEGDDPNEHGLVILNEPDNVDSHDFTKGDLTVVVKPLVCLFGHSI